jgi:uncharacterized protein (UPF0335 family)
MRDATETNGVKHADVHHLLGSLTRADIKKNAIQADIRAIYDLGESKGIPRKALKRLFNRAKVDPTERAQQDLFDAVLERAAGFGDTAPTYDEAAGAFAIPHGIEDEEREDGQEGDDTPSAAPAPPPPKPPKAAKPAKAAKTTKPKAEKPKANGKAANGHANGHGVEQPATMTAATLDKIQDEGKHAGAKGLLRDKNPWPEGGQGHARWDVGWIEGRAIHDFAPAPTAKPPVPAEDGPAPQFE